MEYLYSIQEYAICIHMYMLVNTRIHECITTRVWYAQKGPKVKETRHSSHTVLNSRRTNESILIFIFHVFCRLLILMKSCKTKKMKVIRSQQWYSYKIICKSLFIQKYKLGHLLLIKKNSGPCEKKRRTKTPPPHLQKTKKQKPKILPKIKKNNRLHKC